MTAAKDAGVCRSAQSPVVPAGGPPSHGASQVSLRVRASLQATASRSRSGRMPMSPCRTEAGQPGALPVVPASQLREQMAEDGGQDRHTVPHPAV